MSWKTVHRRGEILHTVMTTLDRRRDGALPMDLAGVRETFVDELDLLGTLQLRWHTRLAGRIERELASQPLDLEEAVTSAWRSTAAEMPGVRLVLDRYRSEPINAAMARAMGISTAKERILLAVMSGRGSMDASAAQATARVGAAIEERARATYAVAAA